MGVHYLISQLFFLSLFVSVSFCKTNIETFRVVGSADCADCQKNNFKTGQAFAGLHVTIDCKQENGNMKRVATTQLNEHGWFKVSLPNEIVHENGQKLKEQCYAQLHNAAAIPCPAPNSLETSKIVLKSQNTFAPVKTLQFSATLCTSKFLWPYIYPNHPWFNHPWFQPTPTYTPPIVTPSPPDTGSLPPPVVNTPPPTEEPLPPANNPPQQTCPPSQPCNQPPVNIPPQQPCPPTQPGNQPPVEPLPPPTNEPPVEPLPPPTNEPPVQPLPPPVPCYQPHPFFNHPKHPCPPTPGQ